MPVVVKSYKWHQTLENIVLKLPLNGIHSSKVDVFTSEKYLKVNYVPFFFEVFLLHKIDEKSSRCTISENEIVFELVKHEIQEWETLHDPEVSNKDAIHLKQQVIEAKQKLAASEYEEKEKVTCELKREAVRNQMSLDSKRLEAIQEIKKTAQDQAMNDLETWRDAQITKPPLRVEKIKTPKPKSDPELKNLPIPESLPRKMSTIKISFSHREFKTPTRESRTEDEQEWLRKQTEARAIAGWAPDDLLPEERNPEYIKQKGNKFFQQQNYIGAVSAYSFGISLSPKYAALYVNRSAANFALGNYYRCVEDCSTALELLTPPVLDNLAARAKCFARRGAALCKLGVPSKGVVEFEAALKLMPGDESLKADLAEARNAIKDEKLDDQPDLFINNTLPSFYK